MKKKKKAAKGDPYFEAWRKKGREVIEENIAEIEGLSKADDLETLRAGVVEKLKELKKDILDVYDSIWDVTDILIKQKNADLDALVKTIRSNNDAFIDTLKKANDRINDLGETVFFNQVMITSHLRGKPMTREEVISMGAERGMEPIGDEGEQSLLFTIGLSAFAAGKA